MQMIVISMHANYLDGSQFGYEVITYIKWLGVAYDEKELQSSACLPYHESCCMLMTWL